MRPVDYSKLKRLKCNVCKKTKSASRFGKYKDASAPLTGWRYYSRCKECNKKQCKEYGSANKPKRNARLKRWRKNNPEKARALDRRRHVSRYGLTLEDVERMRKEQNNRCLLCLQIKALHIDHCHATGKVRGLLCPSCNNVVGKVETHKMIERLQAYIS